jgi:hypothetical protein
MLQRSQLDALASEFLRRREAILDEWRRIGDPAECSVSQVQILSPQPMNSSTYGHPRGWP